jgi:uncharacterized membrane protein YwzB
MANQVLMILGSIAITAFIYSFFFDSLEKKYH